MLVEFDWGLTGKAKRNIRLAKAEIFYEYLLYPILGPAYIGWLKHIGLNSAPVCFNSAGVRSVI